jgi:hypothetical protein
VQQVSNRNPSPANEAQRFSVYDRSVSGESKATIILTFASIDIYVSSLNGTKPTYQKPLTDDEKEDMCSYIPDKHAKQLSEVMGSGMGVLAEIDKRLAQLYKQMCRVTVALDQYSRGIEGKPSLEDLLDARNKTQHGLCSLSPSSSVDNDHFMAFYEVFRLAGLLYADMVILPLPYSSGVKPRLSYQLRQALESPTLATYWRSGKYETMLMWAALIGAIATSLTKDRPWYLEKLRSAIVAKELDWVRFRERMKTCLWWDAVFMAPAAKIWDAVH